MRTNTEVGGNITTLLVSTRADYREYLRPVVDRNSAVNAGDGSLFSITQRQGPSYGIAIVRT